MNALILNQIRQAMEAIVQAILPPLRTLLPAK
jgi:hypothetical protein